MANQENITAPLRRDWERTPFTEAECDEYCRVIEETFGKGWLEQKKANDPLRQAWQKNDQQSTITICRIGRDIRRFRARNDQDQQLHLQDMVRKIQKDPSAAQHYLYELYIAMLFDEDKGFAGKLAPPDTPGFDVTIELSDRRTAFVSCKRLQRSASECDFERAARTLRMAMTKEAKRNGYLSFNALISAEKPLVEYPQTAVLQEWKRLCEKEKVEGVWSLAQYGSPPLSMMIGPSSIILVPGMDVSSLRAAIDFTFLSVMPDRENANVHKMLYKAVKKFRHPSVPLVGSRTVWIVAIEVPEFVSIREVRRLILKEFIGGHFQDISAVLLTRSTLAGDISTQPTRTMAEEFYLLLNERSSFPLSQFSDGGDIPILIRGCHLLDEPQMRIMSNQGDQDVLYGYIYKEFEWILQADTSGTIVLQLPAQQPKVLLPIGSIPAPGVDTSVNIQINSQQG